ncbi:glycosyltransferase [Tamlana sp. 62-3]|uniref:Glycosyltransferase n=1 Tax=Neotamlana sargassicola TaxID=2883125 RepID=A0A9X1I8H3_9FLAO|nr:glycosyltransferase [Tamlana sargassicola]MCB4809217.1 glycosyltransferase [Tamlana sargassicola]
MRNILFVIGSYPSYGGTEKITTVLANAFVNRGHNVSIVSFKQPNPELKDEELHKSIKLFSLSYPVLTNSNIKILKTIIEEQNINIILNQWCLPYYVTKLINKARSKNKCILISALHGAPNQNKRLLTLVHKKNNTNSSIGKKIYKLLHQLLLNLTGYNLRYVYKKSDLYVVLSQSFVNIFKNLANIKTTDKIIAIPNPITIKAPKNLNGLNLNNKQKTILYVGRMDFLNKRVHRVIEAWEQIYEKHPDWNLVLVGDGSEKETLNTYVKNKNIKRVIFESFKKEPPIEFYKKASVLMLTSDLEGFGLVVIEGMAYGCIPIVYGSYPAIYDIIEDTKSGFITPIPYSQDITVKKLESLINNQTLRQNMSRDAYHKAQKFALETTVNNWENKFEEFHVIQ